MALAAIMRDPRGGVVSGARERTGSSCDRWHGADRKVRPQNAHRSRRHARLFAVLCDKLGLTATSERRDVPVLVVRQRWPSLKPWHAPHSSRPSRKCRIDMPRGGAEPFSDPAGFGPWCGLRRAHQRLSLAVAGGWT